MLNTLQLSSCRCKAFRSGPCSRKGTVSVHARILRKVAQNHRKKAGPIQLDTEKLYGTSWLPSREHGPISIDITGKGRGLVTTAPVQPGDLLLVSEPVGPIVRGAQGTNLTHIHLLMGWQNGSLLSAADRRRLALLYDGTPESARRAISLEAFTDADKEKTKKPPAAAPPKGFGSPSKQQAPAPLPTDLSQESLIKVAELNSWGTTYSELGVACARGETSRSCVGIWPEYALINHSCVPNTLAQRIGDRLLVRAVTNIPEGGEITTNYLQSEAGTPLSHRRSILQESYGFKCKCPRCTLEESQPEAINQTLDDMHSWVSNREFSERLKTMLNTRDPGLAAVRKQLDALISRLEGLMEEHKVDQKAREWLRASAYLCYELQAVLKDGGITSEESSVTSEASAANEDVHLPGDLEPLIRVFAPASDAHLFLTLEHLARVGGKHGNTPVTEKPAQECLSLHVIRYGRVSDARLTYIMQERAKVGYNLGRIDLPEVSVSGAGAQ